MYFRKDAERTYLFSFFFLSTQHLTWNKLISSALSFSRYSDFYIVNVIFLKEDFHRLQMGTFRKKLKFEKEIDIDDTLLERNRTHIDFAIPLYVLKIVYNGFYAKSIFLDNAKMISLNNEDGKKEVNFHSETWNLHHFYFDFFFSTTFYSFLINFVTNIMKLSSVDMIIFFLHRY